jgi:hypothetical protein
LTLLGTQSFLAALWKVNKRVNLLLDHLKHEESTASKLAKSKTFKHKKSHLKEDSLLECLPLKKSTKDYLPLNSVTEVKQNKENPNEETMNIDTDDICLIDKLRIDYGRVLFNKINDHLPTKTDLASENDFLLNNDEFFSQNRHLKEFANLRLIKRNTKIVNDWIVKQSNNSLEERKLELEHCK